jgi:hypothetical protein
MTMVDHAAINLAVAVFLRVTKRTWTLHVASAVLWLAMLVLRSALLLYHAGVLNLGAAKAANRVSATLRRVAWRLIRS